MLEFNGNNITDIKRYIRKQFKNDDLILANFGNIGAIVINGMSLEANDKVIKIKSQGGRQRKGPISSLFTIEDLIEYKLIDYDRLLPVLKLDKLKKTREEKIDESIKILKRFDGLSFKRLPLNKDTLKKIPHHLIEDTESGPSIQIFSFLGKPGKLEELMRDCLIDLFGQEKDFIPLLGVTSLNFSGEKSAETNEDIESIMKKIKYDEYISVKGGTPYRSGSFPILDFTGSINRGLTLVREGNLSYYILKLLYPGLRNATRNPIENFIGKYTSNTITKDVISIANEAMKRFNNNREKDKYIELRDYLVNILQDIIVDNGGTKK